MQEPHPDSSLQATPVTSFQVRYLRMLCLYLFGGFLIISK